MRVLNSYRDLKPQNILFTSDSDDAQLKSNISTPHFFIILFQYARILSPLFCTFLFKRLSLLICLFYNSHRFWILTNQKSGQLDDFRCWNSHLHGP